MTSGEYSAKRIVKLVAVIALAAVTGIILGHIMSSYELRFMLDRTYGGTYRGIKVYTVGEVDADNFTDHAYMLSLAPDELVECCDTMYFTGSDLAIPANDLGYESALGLTQGSTIYISTESFGSDVVFHELFHAYDNAHGTLSSNSREFCDAYEKERANLHVIAGHFELYASEFYAQAGSIYLISPQELKARAPLTFEYFNGIFELYDE